MRLVSLKWKAFLLASVMLALLIGTYARLHIERTATLLAAQRAAAQQRYAAEVEALLVQSEQRIRQIGSVVGQGQDPAAFLDGNGSGDGALAFDKVWPALQLELGVELAILYDRSGRQRLARGMAPWLELGRARLAAMVAGVLASETPHSAILCAAGCLRLVTLPILAGGQTAGVLTLGVSMADVLLDFRQVSGTDLGLLVAGDEGSPADAARWLPGWGMRVAAVTRPEQNLALLQRLAHGPLPLAAQRETLAADGRDLAVRAIALTGVDAELYALFIADVSDETVWLRELRRDDLLVGLFGWATSSVMLLAVLWLPMARLRHIADALPLLAERAFTRARERLQRSHPRLRRRLPDEIDVVADTALTLADRLERLEDEVSAHIGELRREKEFVTRLLDTAQVAIFALDRQGRIRRTNPYAGELTGYVDADLLGRPFASLLEAEHADGSVAAELPRLLRGEREHLRHEAPLLGRDGQSYDVVWYHSHLRSAGPDGEAAVLSVGLDISERKRAEQQLAWLAGHDSLTGLCNRHQFQALLEEGLALAQRQRRQGALLFVDLDDFKLVNDSSGHLAGDRLLQQVAAVLRDEVRASDVVGRIGGDEFAVFLPDTDETGALRTAHKLSDRLGRLELPLASRARRLSSSTGIALFPDHGTGMNELLANADMAMYRVKRSGRSVHLFRPEDLDLRHAEETAHWRAVIDHALRHDGLVLWLQPILHIDSDDISHYETLVRLVDEEGKLHFPDSFIPVAERSGQIAALDRVVVRLAMAMSARLAQAGRGVNLAVNLSGTALSDPELCTYVREQLAATAADPGSILFEVTETVAFSDIATAVQTMEAIRRLGPRFALDDFGVGFSSFLYLKQLPVDVVKIDGSFIRHIAADPDDRVLVKALADVARGFGLRTVAEFVENEAILRELASLGIDYAQGYFIDRPRPAVDVFPELAAGQGLESSGRS